MRSEASGQGIYPVTYGHTCRLTADAFVHVELAEGSAEVETSQIYPKMSETSNDKSGLR